MSQGFGSPSSGKGLNDLAASAECCLIGHGKKFYSGFQPYEGVSPQLNTVEASGEKSAAGESVGTDPVFRVQKNWTPCSRVHMEGQEKMLQLQQMGHEAKDC